MSLLHELCSLRRGSAKCCPPLTGREEADLDVEQLCLPICTGGFGLQRLTGVEGVVCKAGYIAAASLNQKSPGGWGTEVLCPSLSAVT